MSSPLSFSSTKSFRNKLLSRNLPPYTETTFTPSSYPGQFDFNLFDYSVIDPGNINDIGNTQETTLYPLNQYGPDGGYTDPVNININKNTNSNEGEYQYFSSPPPQTEEQSRDELYVKNQYGPDGGFNLIVPINDDKGTKSNEGEFEYFSSAPPKTKEQSQKDAFLKNIYGPVNGFDNIITITDVERIIDARNTYYKFIASTYNPIGILLSPDPIGSNGQLSQDSELAQIAASSLKAEFQYRVDEEIYQETLGRINLIDALNDPYDLLAIATGVRSVIEPNWNISVPSDPVGKGLDFISRVSGIYSPYSWIPGDYFSPEGRTSFINQAANSLTGVFGERGTLPETLNGSETFLKNTGQGQKSRLFKTIVFNQYRPNYRVGSTTGLFFPEENYYIGGRNQEIINIISPPDQLPIDKNGNKVRIPVRGYGELATLYENQTTNNFKFGITPKAYINDGNLQGGMSWVPSKNFEGQIGAKYGKDGEILSNERPDPNFNGTESSQYTFTKGSILDNTQRLIDSANELGGDSKLQHVGNAINQISKIFNDGINLITKGSRVMSYVDENGTIVGKEYCRIFAKDTPYATMSDLQKSDGMVDSNRAFQSSVLNNTYNLNIAPIKGNNSTNIKEGTAKKYMFSIENLAWRTSKTPGLSVQDLPECEKGPFGGRIMWFPPYDLKVSEQNSVRWNENEFLGRPEPIYTYNNTKRQGTLSWKIVVDHPSILNAIVDKELQGKDSETINGVVDSFMAGCRKYDIYELAQRFPQFTYSDIYEILEKSNDPVTINNAGAELPNNSQVEESPTIEPQPKINKSDYDFGFYFDNDVPGPKDATTPTADEDYLTSLNNYIENKTTYIDKAINNQKAPVTTFFDTKINNIKSSSEQLALKIGEALNNGASINIDMVGSASSPNSPEYNQDLSERRIDAIKKYILSLNDSNGNPLNRSNKITFSDVAEGENTTIDGSIVCGNNLPDSQKIYSVNAMACRRVKITNITETYPPPILSVEEITTTPTTNLNGSGDTNGEPQKNTTTQELGRKKDVAKIIVRKLLTECNYFNYLEENAPFVYENIKEKLKYFQPVFHSTTPEGLNSRLTFLQQCLRPGDTIPTIGVDGQPKYGDAKNTSFGSPPICVLRIGDFYHTKIAINQISINYEPLQFDLNPEGIGVQPMIADINMSFYFIGGQGLEAPVAKLQNALSFNYYGNTEVYDERADATEDRTEFDKEVWNDIIANTPFGVNSTSDNQLTNDAQSTIGKVLTTTIITSPFETLSGTTSYTEIMKDLSITTKEYVDTITSTIENINNEYLVGGLRLFTENRKYTQGGFNFGVPLTSIGMTLFGKPENITSNVNDLFTKLLSDNESETSPLYINIFNQNFKNSDIKKYKKQIQNVINAKRQTYTQTFNTNLTNVVEIQQKLIRIIDKLSFVRTEYDGYRISTNQNILFSISGTTEITVTADPGVTNTQEELSADIEKVRDDVFYFNTNLYFNGLLDDNVKFTDYNSGSTLNTNITTPEQVRFFTAFAKDVTQNKETFIQSLLGEELSKDIKWTQYLTNIVNNLSVYYNESYQFINVPIQFFKRDVDQVFNKYSPYSLDKTRKFNYIKLITNPAPAETDFNNLYLGRNTGNNNWYNLKTKLD